MVWILQGLLSAQMQWEPTRLLLSNILSTPQKKRKRLGWHLNKATINIYQRTFKRHLQDNIFALLYPGKYTLAIVARKKDKPSFKKSYSRQP